MTLTRSRASPSAIGPKRVTVCSSAAQRALANRGFPGRVRYALAGARGTMPASPDARHTLARRIAYQFATEQVFQAGEVQPAFVSCDIRDIAAAAARCVMAARYRIRPEACGSGGRCHARLDQAGACTMHSQNGLFDGLFPAKAPSSDNPDEAV